MIANMGLIFPVFLYRVLQELKMEFKKLNLPAKIKAPYRKKVLGCVHT
jgi:hypothetical protein